MSGEYSSKGQSKADLQLHRWVYRQRNFVERFFNRIKQMRGQATRHDRRADNYLAALKLATVRIWIASLNEPVSQAGCRLLMKNQVAPDGGFHDARGVALFTSMLAVC